VHWLQLLDVGVLRFINQTLSNWVFDALMPFASGNKFFFPTVFLIGAFLLWRGGRRGKVSVLMLLAVVAGGDPLICNNIKHAVERPRPFITHPDILTPASSNRRDTGASEDKPVSRTSGKSGYNSMPSAHAANWFAATTVLFFYYRRSLKLMLPLACLVCFSRIYNGVHYPSDVLAGAILGTGYSLAALGAVPAIWHWLGRKWFPRWWQKLPSLANPDLIDPPASTADSPRAASVELHWLRLGYLIIPLLLFFRLAYLYSEVIQLSEDEAYQWLWSKHLALSYFSKPPMIAYAQFVGTHLWGDTQLGVRFFSPVLAALTSLVLLRFMARNVNTRASLILLLVATTTPLLAVGSTLMTVDPLSVFFWVIAMTSGWRAIQPESRTRDWIWTGLWMGLGFLSKYTALFQWLCWLVFFIAWKPARIHLRRPGPYLALLVNGLCTLPVLIWNVQHQWITVSHVAENAGLQGKWTPRVLDFLGLEFGLLNPIYFVATAWAAIAFWRRLRQNTFALYLFSMGAPLFVCYLLWSFHSRVFPNWIAPSIPALFCLMIVYWHARWDEVRSWARKYLFTGLVLGLVVVLCLHNTNFVAKLAGIQLPPKLNPSVRVQGWEETAKLVNDARKDLELEGKPVFIIGGHYGITSLINFYLPEARTNIHQTLLAYCVTSQQPKNQFYFWPGYRELRRGQNAIFIRELSGAKLERLKNKSSSDNSVFAPDILPPIILQEFESVTDRGQLEVLHRGRVFHTYQLFECRNLK
jgi:membrane-associated phospholipid phosphatase